MQQRFSFNIKKSPFRLTWTRLAWLAEGLEALGSIPAASNHLHENLLF